MNLLIISLLFITHTLCYDGPNITMWTNGTHNATLQGKIISVLGQNMTEYLGVPYARPPIGPYRFAPPIEFTNGTYWNGPYYAVHLADACPQLIRVMNFSGYDDGNPKNYSESCLKFNMWVPNNRTNMSVIIFYHGGSFTVRTASVDKFNGSVLALTTNSVVITPNYRLGFFGFAYLNDSSDIPGNMGLLDQQMVLKWVNTHIEKFGGCKNNVTIFGTSSGSSSVSAHFFSNESRKYFKRGIMSSGTITHFMSTVSRQIADANTRNVSRLVNCTKETNSSIQNGTGKEIAECLKGKNVTVLLEAARKVRAFGQPPTPFPFMPIDNDTVFFNGSIKIMYNQTTFAKDLDLMIGRTADEGTFFMATGFTNKSDFGCYFYPQKPANSSENNCTMNETHFQNLVKFGGKILNFTDNEIKNLTTIYNESASTYTNRSIRLISDFMSDCEISTFARKYSNVSSKNTYFYEYTRRSPINVWPPWTGAMHGDDLIAMFGTPFRHPEKYNNTTLESEKSYSEHVMWMIGNFSKYGNPNSESKWHKLNNTYQQGLIFNGTLNLNLDLAHQNHTPPTCIKLFKLLQQYKNRTKAELEGDKTKNKTK